ncbi:sensor histidine kinase [Polaribacter aquimarinus]|uniref:sensor histidine kinase n=1 Tax=Polaribacter aquimarinus TaxID=2100726 RepID=UPI0015E825BC|nr:sensor histidine kinase [Polaribacter aquimarinus]
MKKRKFNFLDYLLNPYVISFCITIGVLLLLPNYFNKYLLIEGNDKKFNTKDSRFFYEDIDNDGLSEKVILINNNETKKASYMLFHDNGDLIDQFNLDTEFDLDKQAWFQDTNANNIKEIYILTKSNDSIFLTIQEHISWEKPVKEKVFVDAITPFNGVYHFRGGRPSSLYNLNYPKKYVHFSICVGYGGNPRSVYRYDPTTKTILKSPHLTNSFGISDFFDVDDDGKAEIFLGSYATANTIDSIFTKKSDSKIWMNFLDDNLTFLFEPKAYPFIGTLYQKGIIENEQKFIISLIDSKEKEKGTSKLLKQNTQGEIVLEKILDNCDYSKIKKVKNDEFLTLDQLNRKIRVFNYELDQIDEIYVGGNYGSYYTYDINKDNRKELILYDNNVYTLTIYDESLKHAVSVSLPTSKTKLVEIGVRYPNATDSQIFIHLESGVFYYNYVLNPYYPVRFLFYFGVYGFVLLLTFLIAKGQQIREQRKRKLEKEIADLQLKTIKNKVDPHFVFNAMNTISEMSLMDDKLEIDRFISRFSNFMRGTLEHSDKISTTLKEEITYTENFIKLQQIRFNHQFEYSISVDKNIDKSFKIPKHSIFSYVENALKYGLPSQEKGNLKIKIDKIKQQIVIQIQDNGAGFNKANKKNHKGTGNGLKIMNKIFNLYENRYKTKIEHTVQELKNETEIKGVLVTIKITPNTKN